MWCWLSHATLPPSQSHYHHCLPPFSSSLTQYLKDGTLFFSHYLPNLQKAILAMDKIDNYFTNHLKDHSLNVAIHASIISAKATLNKYYKLMDHAEVYRIEMGELSVQYFSTSRLWWLWCYSSVLDPCYKLRYFKKAGWDNEWIALASNWF